MLFAARISMTDDASSIGRDEENPARKNNRNSASDGTHVPVAPSTKCIQLGPEDYLDAAGC